MLERLAQLETELGRLAAKMEDLRAERDGLRQQLSASEGLRRKVEQLERRNRELEWEQERLRERVAVLLQRVDAAIADGE